MPAHFLLGHVSPSQQAQMYLIYEVCFVFLISDDR